MSHAVRLHADTNRHSAEVVDPTAPSVSIRDLSVSYSARPALRGVDFVAPAGRLTAMVGPSGCGKSSLLASVNRLTDLVPGCQVTGEIRVGDADVMSPTCDVTALRLRVGMIFQRPTPFPLSIRRNLELPLREHRTRDRHELAARVEAALRDVGLWDEVKDRLDAPAAALSGGQQQRLCLARALALEPEVLLLDEPCSALDPLSSGVVEDLVASLRGRYTLLLVTHDLAQARRLADDAAFFWVEEGVGRLVESGAAAQIFEAPQSPLTRAYVAGRRA